jgi:hypothetical protein
VQTADFDLTTILGCKVHEVGVQRFIEFCEEAPTPTERFPSGFYYLQFWQTGVSLLVNASGIVTSIHIHSQPDSEYVAYPYALPLGATAGTTQVEARLLLCPPSQSGGPVQFLPTSPVTYWDLWEFGDHDSL